VWVVLANLTSHPEAKVLLFPWLMEMQKNLIYPASTREPAIAGKGEHDNHHLTDLVESISGNMGEPSDDAKESGSRGWETIPKTSKAFEGSQRGHSTRRTGKPSTGGRATA
jgi:hypothetical protein